MDKKMLVKALQALEVNGMRLIIKEFNENILFPDYKSYRIGTALIELVKKKDTKKKSKALMEEVMELNEIDYKNNLSKLKKRFKKESKQSDKFEEEYVSGKSKKKKRG